MLAGKSKSTQLNFIYAVMLIIQNLFQYLNFDTRKQHFVHPPRCVDLEEFATAAATDG